ncbi:MAG: VWA domain-containing protein, partial [Acidimicrobiia bacterium]|nr:VWA domain-containing protein [Acidimicrobiia bacterium]
MTKESGTVALLLLLMAMMLPSASALGAEHVDQVLPLRIELIDHSDHPDIAITVSVPRELVGTDISEDQFAVLEGTTQVVPTVSKLSSDDLEVVLVLDTSGSMAGAPLAEAKSAAKAFTAQLPAGVRVAVVGFGSAPQTATDFTTDLSAADSAIDGLSAQGETALYDAVAAAAGLFENEARRVVVVLSDGGDTVSGSSLEQAIIGLLAAEADFYAVGLDTSETDDAALSRMSIASDGALVAAEDPAALAGIFDEIASGLVNRYLLRYTSESFDATEVLVAVAASGIL